MSSTLLNKKSSLTSRRNIIIYIIATILILGIVAGFTNTFHTDNRKFAASWGETIVIEAEPPASGSPSDYDLLSNLKFTAYKLHHSTYFRGVTEGKISADIGIGSYTQNLVNTRVVYKENIVFTETISTSKLKSIAEQKYADNGIIIYRPADKIDGDKTTFASKAVQMSYDEYSKKYGLVPNQLSKYIINEKTILSVKDENAQRAFSLNNSGEDDGVSFDVPDRLVPNADGNYVFTLTLDPTESTLYYRNEVRTLGDADQNPKFYSVKITITMDSDWMPISTRAIDEYDIEIPVLGAMRCTGDNLETFSMINEDGDIPEKDFFQPYVDQAKENPDYVPPEVDMTQPPSASDYLASAFEKYLSGESNLDLTADIVMGDFSMYDITLSVNLDTLDIQAMLGKGLYIKYSGDKLYIKNNEINGYINVKDAAKLADDPMLKGLLGGVGNIDINKIFGGDILDKVFENCEMTTNGGVTEITMSFALDLSDLIPSLNNVSVNAAIKINDKDMSLKAITGQVDIGDTVIDIDVQPIAQPKFPSTEGAVDLTGIVDFVQDAISFATQTTYGIDGTVTYNGMDIGVSAYVDRAAGDVEAMLNVMGIDVSVKYIDGIIYIDTCGLSVRGTIDELPVLLDATLGSVDISKYQSLLQGLLPSSINQIVDMLKRITVDDTTLNVGLKALNMPIDIELTRGEGKLKSVALAVKVNLLNINADVAVRFDLSNPDAHTVTLPTATEYLTFADLAALITDAKPYLDAEYYNATINGYVDVNGTNTSISGDIAIDNDATGVKADGKLSAIGQDIRITYTDGVVYVTFGGIKAKLDTADDNLISSATKLVGLLLGGDGLPQIDITAAISNAVKSAHMTDGILFVTLAVEGVNIDLSVDLKSGAIVVTVKGDVSAKLYINVTTSAVSHGITAPTDANEYIDADKLSPMLDTAAKILSVGGIRAIASVDIGGITLNALIEATLQDGTLKARITVDSLGLTAIILGDTAYIEIGGIKVSGRLDDVTELIDAVIPNLPDIIRPYVEEMTRQMSGIIPSSDELMTDGRLDPAKAADTVLSIISSLTVQGNIIRMNITRGVLAATLFATTDLSSINGSIRMAFDGIGGPFGEHFEIAFDLGLQGITAAKVNIPAVAAEEFVPASEIIDALGCVLPLVKQSAFDLDIDVTLFDQEITGNIYINLGDYTLDTIAAQIALNVSDVPIVISVIERELYLDVNNGSIRLMLPLTKEGITELIEQLDEALPNLEIKSKLAELLNSVSFDDIVISELLDRVTLSPTDDGMTLSIALDGASIAMDIAMSGSLLDIINISASVGDSDITIAVQVTTTEDGVLCGMQAAIVAADTEIGLSLGINPAAKRDVEVDGDYVAVADIIPYISPVMSLVEKAMGAKAISIDLSNMAIEIMGKKIAVSGRVQLSLSPISVRASLILFAGSEDQVELNVVYVNDVVYVDIGKIALKFDISTDVEIINAAIEPYLPKALNNLGDLSALSPIFAVIDGITKIADSTDAAEIIQALLGTDNAYGKSVIKQALDLITVFERSNGNLTIGATVMDRPTITVNVEPIISGDRLDFKLDAGVSNMLSFILTAKIDIFDSPINITAPTDGDYTPIVDFVTTVINAVNTLTAKADDIVTEDEDGNVTTISQTAFEVSAFAFDYDMYKIKSVVDENGDTQEVLDETGRPEIERDANGNKVKEKTARVQNINGQQALRFGLTKTTVTDKDGRQISNSTDLMIEAHLRIEIIGEDGKAQTGFPIEIDLYVADKLAYVYYRESNGYGEKISIDFKSVLQIVTAVLDILGADDDMIESLLGDYRLDIDSTVFNYLSIAGLDDVTALINNLVKAVDELKQALAYGKTAWNRLQNAEDIDALIREITSDTAADGSDTIKVCLDGLIEHIKAAIALFQTDESEEDVPKEETAVNSKLIKDVVNSIHFSSEASVLTAYVDNALATGTEGEALVSVVSYEDKLSRIGVTNLDAHDAKVNTFDVRFNTVSELLVVSIPDDYQSEVTNGDKVRYADLSNIKYLLFDIMNTANLMEFEIGSGSSDKINVKMDIPLLVKLDINIGYNAKVKLIDTGETDSEGNPIIKTAVAIDIYNSKAEAKALSGLAKAVIIPECTTSLYFYDDVIYLEGVKNWDTASMQVGKLTQVSTPQKRDKITSNNWYDSGTPTTSTTSYSVNTASTHRLDYVNVAYTVDELLYMMGNDINRFLDEFLYYLIPITNDKVLGLVNIRDTIRDQIGGSNDNSNNTKNTLAQIFKSYTYSNGAHNIVIGLAELAGSSSLSDLNLTLTGANNDDDETTGNVLNNYVTTLSLSTNIAKIIDVSLNASLNNVVENSDGTISSRGLSSVGSNQAYNSFSFNGNTYATPRNHLPDTVLTLDGTPMYSALAENTQLTSLPRFIKIAAASSYDEQVPEDRLYNTETSGGGVLSKDRTIKDNYYWLTDGYRLIYDYYIGYENGVPYVYRQDGNTVIRSKVVSVMDALLADVVRDAHGKVKDVVSRNGGVQWTRPWKDAYDASQSA
ncbi:MAG: hypothetical protein J1F71_04610 [Clostridiales bacterium]|nr:hypothetical protein [Clostridiales bacterium]